MTSDRLALVELLAGGLRRGPVARAPWDAVRAAARVGVAASIMLASPAPKRGLRQPNQHRMMLMAMATGSAS
jgi:hypothetical protein